MSRELRRFAYGPHPDARTRAGHVAYVGELFEEVILVIGSAFADLLGREYHDNSIKPLIRSLLLVREQHPPPG